MFKLAADHNVDGDILRGIRRRVPDVDLVRAVDAGLSAATDPEILEWAAVERRVLITHDASTMVAFAYQRLSQGLPLSGVLVIGSRVSVGRAIEDLVTIVECTTVDEWKDRVLYVPL